MRSTTEKTIHSDFRDNHLVEICDSATRRSLYFDSNHLQSAMSLLCRHELILSYTRYMLFSLLIQPDPEQILVIGLGSGSFIRYFHHHFPTSQITGVDLSQHVIDLAQGYFSLPQSENIELHCRGGLEFMENAAAEGKRYDLILIDAFDSHGMAPSVYSPSCFALAQSLLEDGGCISFNLWSSDKQLYLEIRNHIRATYEGSLILPVPDRGNVVAVAMNMKIPWEKILLGKNELKDRSRKLELEFKQFVKTAKQNNLGLRMKLRNLFH